MMRKYPVRFGEGPKEKGCSRSTSPPAYSTRIYIYRAIDQDGHVVDAYFSRRRNSEAAETFFERAIDETGVRPERVTTDKATCYPPALRAVLPSIEHRTSKYRKNGMERDHGHLKQRIYPMRGFKQATSADTIAPRPRLVMVDIYAGLPCQEFVLYQAPDERICSSNRLNMAAFS